MKTFFALATLLTVAIGLSSAAAPANSGSVLPRPEPAYTGTLGRTVATSSPPTPAPPFTAPKGAPNVLLIMTDDTGFGSASTFGGPIPTPAINALAARGLVYNRFHTSALCSPTRAALLTDATTIPSGSGS